MVHGSWFTILIFIPVDALLFKFCFLLTVHGWRFTVKTLLFYNPELVYGSYDSKFDSS